MNWFSAFLRSTVGAKLAVAVTGILMFLFLIMHLSGNLLVFAGQDAINTYSQNLRRLGPLLWIARVGLLVSVIAHVILTIRLTRQNAAARQVRYAIHKPQVSSLASRAMIVSGLIVMVFIFFHLAHLTFGVVFPDHFALRETVTNLGQTGSAAVADRQDVYGMMVAGFKNPMVAGFYVLALVLLGMHLAHGISSVFQTLGVNHPKYNGVLRKSGPALATVIILGFISIPLAILFGAVGA
ncbi:MAG: succinate dehydrogenase cytochrome b subunit [Myxococcales bacterium]|nr:succinate dehydrogenase cytochrome b subunit [Myxococcales bacterium]